MWSGPAGATLPPLVTAFNTVTDQLFVLLGDAVNRMRTAYQNNPYLARVLGEAVAGAARTNTFLGERYRRLARRPSTSASATTTPAPAPNAPSATTSDTCKPSATPSPSTPPPDPTTTRPGSAALSRDAVAHPVTSHFRISQDGSRHAAPSAQGGKRHRATLPL